MMVLASLLIDLGLVAGITNNTGINLFFLFYMTLAFDFLPGDAVKGGGQSSWTHAETT